MDADMVGPHRVTAARPFGTLHMHQTQRRAYSDFTFCLLQRDAPSKLEAPDHTAGHPMPRSGYCTGRRMPLLRPQRPNHHRPAETARCLWLSRTPEAGPNGILRGVAPRRARVGPTLIAVNTNVVLRYLLNDDPAQAERARRLFGHQDGVLITDVVIAETVWTLLGRRYRTGKAEIMAAIERLLEEALVEFEEDEVIWRALQNYRETDADFADALVVQKGAQRCVEERPRA